MRVEEAKRDPFRRLALRSGFKSRAAFKLIEIERKVGLFREGNRVIDLGSAPGSWLQVASSRVGEHGLVIGVDLSPVRFSTSNIKFIQGDILDPGIPQKLHDAIGGLADVILSDAATKMTGVRSLDEEKQVELIHAALNIAIKLLKRGGKAVFKAFEGVRSRGIEGLLRSYFHRVIRFRPSASRRHGREFYFVCIDFRGMSPYTLKD